MKPCGAAAGRLPLSIRSLAGTAPYARHKEGGRGGLAPRPAAAPGSAPSTSGRDALQEEVLAAALGLSAGEAAAAAAQLGGVPAEALAERAAALAARFKPGHAAHLARAAPAALRLDLPGWMGFFEVRARTGRRPHARAAKACRRPRRAARRTAPSPTQRRCLARARRHGPATTWCGERCGTSMLRSRGRTCSRQVRRRQRRRRARPPGMRRRRASPRINLRSRQARRRPRAGRPPPHRFPLFSLPPMPNPSADSCKGRAILFLKRLGPWVDADVAARVLPVHAPLLGVEEARLEAVVARLRALEISEERVGAFSRAGAVRSLGAPPARDAAAPRPAPPHPTPPHPAPPRPAPPQPHPTPTPPHPNHTHPGGPRFSSLCSTALACCTNSATSSWRSQSACSNATATGTA
jgi:hypothetical protein